MAHSRMVPALEFEAAAHEKKVIIDFDNKAVEKVIERLKSRKIPVLPVCVTGPRRSGKSFLVNLLISRFTFDGQKGKSWLEDERIVEGVEWSRGSEQVTKGMSIWPEPLMVKNAIGMDVAILLFDCQGLYESVDCAETIDAVMALYSLELSSVYIFNSKGDIDGNDLMHLKRCAQFAKDTWVETKFKTLLFVARDWAPDEKFGERENHLDSKEKKGTITKNEKQVKDAFARTPFVALPYPGKFVKKLSVGSKTSPKELAEETDDDFMKYVDELAKFIEDCANLKGHRVPYNDFVKVLKSMKDHSQRKDNLNGFKSFAHVLEDNAIAAIRDEVMHGFVSNLRSIDVTLFSKEDDAKALVSEFRRCKSETTKYLQQKKTERRAVLRRHEEPEDLCDETWQKVNEEVEKELDDIIKKKLEEFAGYHNIKDRVIWLKVMLATAGVVAPFSLPIAIVVGCASWLIYSINAASIDDNIRRWRKRKFEDINKRD